MNGKNDVMGGNGDQTTQKEKSGVVVDVLLIELRVVVIVIADR